MVILIPLRTGHNDENFGWQYGPAPDGSVGVEFSFRNDTEKTIQSATFIFAARNAAGEAEACSRTGSSEFAARYTGPLAPGAVAPTMFVEHCWYNPAIVRAEISRAEVIYANGQRDILYQDQIRYGSAYGCYIATCVYGSYDCPPVWTLRRFRDGVLAPRAAGRLFIRLYYALSPRLVARLGQKPWFQALGRCILDRLVRYLRSRGFSDAPYRDTPQPRRQSTRCRCPL